MWIPASRLHLSNNLSSATRRVRETCLSTRARRKYSAISHLSSNSKWRLQPRSNWFETSARLGTLCNPSLDHSKCSLHLMTSPQKQRLYLYQASRSSLLQVTHTSSSKNFGPHFESCVPSGNPQLRSAASPFSVICTARHEASLKPSHHCT